MEVCFGFAEVVGHFFEEVGACGGGGSFVDVFEQLLLSFRSFRFRAIVSVLEPAIFFIVFHWDLGHGFIRDFGAGHVPEAHVASGEEVSVGACFGVVVTFWEGELRIRRSGREAGGALLGGFFARGEVVVGATAAAASAAVGGAAAAASAAVALVATSTAIVGATAAAIVVIAAAVAVAGVVVAVAGVVVALPNGVVVGSRVHCHRGMCGFEKSRGSHLAQIVEIDGSNFGKRKVKVRFEYDDKDQYVPIDWLVSDADGNALARGEPLPDNGMHRAPHPTIHLIRNADLASLSARDVSRVKRKNAQLLARIGWDGVQEVEAEQTEAG